MLVGRRDEIGAVPDCPMGRVLSSIVVITTAEQVATRMAGAQNSFNPVTCKAAAKLHTAVAPSNHRTSDRV